MPFEFLLGLILSMPVMSTLSPGMAQLTMSSSIQTSSCHVGVLPLSLSSGSCTAILCRFMNLDSLFTCLRALLWHCGHISGTLSLSTSTFTTVLHIEHLNTPMCTLGIISDLLISRESSVSSLPICSDPTSCMRGIEAASTPKNLA